MVIGASRIMAGWWPPALGLRAGVSGRVAGMLPCAIASLALRMLLDCVAAPFMPDRRRFIETTSSSVTPSLVAMSFT